MASAVSTSAHLKIQRPPTQVAMPPPPPGENHSPSDDADPTLAITGLSSPDEAQARNANRQSVSVACVNCRARHLKCGGGLPCARCQTEALECSYIKSRRGFKGPRRARQSVPNRQPTIADQGARVRKPLQQQQQQQQQQQRIQHYVPREVADLGSSDAWQEGPNAITLAAMKDLESVDAPADLSPPATFDLTARKLSTMYPVSTPMSSSTASVQSVLVASPPSAKHDGLSQTAALSAFYEFFFSAHPFLLPRSRLERALSERHLPHLRLAVDFIGSAYTGEDNVESYTNRLQEALFGSSPLADGFAVQARLLFAIGTHMNGDPERASTIMDSAIDLAFAIGMNQLIFAIANGENDKVLEESWRRTWWELFVVDAMISASIQRPFFRMETIPMDVLLPCEEVDYLSGVGLLKPDVVADPADNKCLAQNIPDPRSISDFDGAAFASEDIVYSSFTYLIDAIRNLAKIMSLARGEMTDLQSIEIVETAIANFALHLPEEKRELISLDGQFDEVLFQAHMVSAASSILLHRPRSNLIIENVRNVKTCVKSGEAFFPTQERVVHSAQAIRAAETISRLSTLPTPLAKHSPFFTCMVTQAAVVHLSYWSFLVPDAEDALVKQQVRLDIGVLRTLSEMWPIGKRVLSQVKGVAQEMFTARKSLNLAPWSYMAEEEMLHEMQVAEMEMPGHVSDRSLSASSAAVV